jgi:hypothetical protein
MLPFFFGVVNLCWIECENNTIRVLFCNVNDCFLNEYLKIFFDILIKRYTT